ncbi:MAG TPA: ATP-binding protein [Thermoanaerobaculia bacterium]|nr:ATP-binding protein [Thermoanaerobaculia bacterium]
MVSLRRQLSWYIGLRLLVITSMALPYVFSRLSHSGGGTVPNFYGQLFGLTCLATLVYIFLLRLLRQRLEVHAYLQFAGDLVLSTSLIYQFGSNSPFSPFYVVVIIVASMMLGQSAALLVATGASLLYCGLQLALASGWMVSPSAGVETGLTARLVYSLFIHVLGFYSVALLTSRLTRRAEVAEEAFASQREDLADLKVAHRDIIESVPSGLATTDLDGNLTTLNRAGELILGIDATALLGRPVTESGLFSLEQWAELTSLSGQEGRYRSERSIKRDGGRVDVGFSVSRLTDSENRERGYILIFQDLTPWRKLEEELRLKDRMAAVGELAAGLAHEIGNPLAAISGSVQMLSQGASRAPAEQKLLDILLKESQRLDRTIKGFLRFARPKEKATVRLDVAALLAENVELLRNSPEISPGHQIELRLDPPSAILLGDPDQISQIFWNVVRNALKAMPGGGRLTIEGRMGESSYTMRFRDEGRGMTEEERSRLFLPFQSSFASGTGIGMAIVYRIVQEHGGRLSVDSSPGRGTLIVVELPTAPAAPAGEAT